MPRLAKRAGLKKLMLLIREYIMLLFTGRITFKLRRFCCMEQKACDKFYRLC